MLMFIDNHGTLYAVKKDREKGYRLHQKADKHYWKSCRFGGLEWRKTFAEATEDMIKVLDGRKGFRWFKIEPRDLGEDR